MSRPDRADEVKTERRRRSAATLDRGYALKLAIPAEFENDTEHVYRWANDVGTRIYDLTVEDDYDVVTSSKAEATDQDKFRKPVGVNEQGQPIHAVLLRKRRDFHEADQRAKDVGLRAKEQEAVHVDSGSSDSDASQTVVKAQTVKHGGYVP